MACNQCDSLAREMDRKGPKWCLENLGYIVDKIQENAKKRGLAIEGKLNRYGLKQIVIRSIRISQGKRPTILNSVAMAVAKRKLRK